MAQPNGQPTATPFDLLLFGATGDLALAQARTGVVSKTSRRPDRGGLARAGGRQDQPKPRNYLAQIEETCRKYLRPEEFSA